jgi:Glycosyl hydrolase 108
MSELPKKESSKLTPKQKFKLILAGVAAIGSLGATKLVAEKLSQPTIALNTTSQISKIANQISKDIIVSTENQNKIKNEIILHTFKLEGFDKNGSLTKVSYHGSETFLTNAAGITEMTYHQYQQKKGIKLPKQLAQMSVAEVFEILEQEYWSKITDNEVLPESIMMMRFQSMWNLGEGREKEVWQKTLEANQKVKLFKLTKAEQTKIINDYATFQREATVKYKKPIYQSGIFTRISQSVSLANKYIK